MIKKIELIKGIGRFYNHSVHKDATFEFEKHTLFHAMNGYGKSTIVAILKSLSENDPVHVRRKKTLGQSIDPHIVIALVDGGTIRFENGAWSACSGNRPIIEVFDSHFVHDNLFVQEVTIDHKKNIHRIIIGEQGKTLADNLEKANQAEKTAKKDFDTRTQELQERIVQTERRDYLEIQDEEKITIDEKITNLETQIKARESEDKIEKLSVISEVSRLIIPDFDSIKNVLQISHQTLHEEAKILVENHFEQCFKDSSRAKSFIRDGLSQKKGDDCPFCGQNLANAQELIGAYASYFDETHQKAVSQVQEEYRKWQAWRFDSSLDACLSAKVQSQHVLEKWKEYLGDTLSVISENGFSSVESDRSRVADIIALVKDMFENKIADLQSTPNVATIDELATICDGIQKSIDAFNGEVASRNNEIAEYREGLKKGDTLDEMRGCLKKLTSVLGRFEETEKKWCLEYSAAKKAFEDAQYAHLQAKQDLANYSTNVFNDFQKEINTILSELGTTFHLADLVGDSNKKSSEPFCDFAVAVNNTSSPLQTKDTPCFKWILSEGDKNSLAFAFFIAKLRKSGQIKDTIIVFDDPISSMDSHRRLQTVRILNDLSLQAKQCLIFSHYEDFLLMAWDKFHENRQNRRAFCIRSDETNGSRIEKFDIENARSFEQHKRISRLEKYSKEDNGENPQSMQADIRLCLETQIRFKYFRHLSNQTTLGSILDVLDEKKLLPCEVIQVCRDLNGNSSPAHHGEYRSQPLQNLTRQEVVSDIQKLLDVLEKI